MLPTEYTVANEIRSQYDSIRNSFLSIVKPVASQNGFACSFDFSQSGPDYGVLVIHYIDQNWDLHSFVVNFVPFPMGTPKTGLNVVEFVTEMLCDNGFDAEESSNVSIVTDEASNMNEFPKHIRCACHILNTVAKRISEPYKDSKLSPEVKKDCKSVQSALHTLQKLIVKLRGFTVVRETLGTCLHVPGETRWMSKVEMVDCFLKSRLSITEVVREKKPDLASSVEELYTVYGTLLQDYLTILKPIKPRIKDLEVDLLADLVVFKAFRGRIMSLFRTTSHCFFRCVTFGRKSLNLQLRQR